jgi:uncharacterized protein with von Willebrand factor type A (vWA) domain
MSSNKSLVEYIEESTKNIENDRAVASKLLLDLVDHMNKHAEDKYTHKNFGEIAAMYLETLQRSNEQLVKIAAIVQRQEGGDKDGMSKKERDAIFDMIKEG